MLLCSMQKMAWRAHSTAAAVVYCMLPAAQCLLPAAQCLLQAYGFDERIDKELALLRERSTHELEEVPTPWAPNHTTPTVRST
jgi:hypothetical protein